jgi:hypothetical protein
MSNAALKIPFVPRANLKRTIAYRASLKRMFYFQAGYGGFLFVIAIAATVYASTYAAASTPKTEFWINTFPAYFFFLSAILFAVGRSTQDLAYTKIHVKPDSLTIEKQTKSIELAYHEIDAVKLAFIPRMGGWFDIVLKDKTKHRFPVGLERSEYILEAIAAYNPELISLPQIEEYRRTSVVGDHFWARSEENFRNWPSRVAKYIGLPLTAILLFAGIKTMKGNPFLESLTEYIVFKAVFFGLISLVIGSAIYFITENRISKNGRDRLMADPNNVLRDMPYERKILKWGNIAHYALFAATLAAIFIFRK